jgi:hypothetical protein
LFNEGEYDADPGILRQFAKISGGEAFLPKNLDGVSDACHRIAKEIRTATLSAIFRRCRTAPNH